MFGSTGFHHPKTKKEMRAETWLEARNHAKTCDELAVALRRTHPSDLVLVHALEQAAKFIRHYTKAKATASCTADAPCCGRRDVYNGFASGPLAFECPKRCACHD